MKFFNRRARAKSINRNNAKERRNGQAAHRPDDDISVGSDLPTVDQFEIAVPSKSFTSAGGDEPRFPADAREDEGLDDRSNTDVSSITSVSYRAGYYYLRNIKKNTPEKKHPVETSSGCCAAPTCSCSWLTCCCCAEANSELTTEPTSKNSIVLEKQRKSQRSPSAQRAILLSQARDQPIDMNAYERQDRPGFSYLVGKSVHRGVYRSKSGSNPAQNVLQRAVPRRKSGSNYRHNQRYSQYVRPTGNIPEAILRTKERTSSPMREEELKMYPELKRNQSLFDQLSEDEEVPVYGQRHKVSEKKMIGMPWLPRPGGSSTRLHARDGRDRPRSHSRGRSGATEVTQRGRRFERYHVY